MDLSNIFRFPGAPEPTPEPERTTNGDPFALVATFGRTLIEAVGDMSLGEALEKLSRQPAKAVLGTIFEGWTGDSGHDNPH